MDYEENVCNNKKDIEYMLFYRCPWCIVGGFVQFQTNEYSKHKKNEYSRGKIKNVIQILYLLHSKINKLYLLNLLIFLVMCLYFIYNILALFGRS